MADTSTVTSELDVLSKYNSLVKASLGSESTYIRAKETVQELVADGSLDDSQKAKVISDIIGGAVSSITGASMTAALQWAKTEKELALKKLELDQQLNIMATDILLREAQVAQVDEQNRLAKIESRRMFGTGTFDVSGALLTLTETGKVWNDMALVTQNTVNAAEQKLLIESKVKESEAAIHKVVADTYTNFGSFTYAYDPSSNGFTSVTPNVVVGQVTLSQTQQEIAIEQGKGYSYNAWANALTGSASMLGTAIASDYFDFGPLSPGTQLLETVLDCAKNLRDANSTDAEAIPVVTP